MRLALQVGENVIGVDTERAVDTKVMEEFLSAAMRQLPQFAGRHIMFAMIEITPEAAEVLQVAEVEA